MNPHEEIAPPAHKNFLSPGFTKEDSTKAYSDVYERDLTPYDDEDFLAGRINAQNRLLRKNPELVATLSASLQADDDESLLGAADILSATRAAQAPAHEKPINSLLSYFTLLKNIEDISEPTSEAQSRVNAIATLVAKRLINELPEDQLQTAYYSAAYLKFQFEKLASHNKINAPYIAKFEQLRSLIDTKQTAVNYIDALPQTESQPVSSEQVADDSRYISELFQTIQSSRQYGVKMGYTSDGSSGSLIFSDPPDLSRYIPDYGKALAHQLVLHNSAAAQIVHSSKKNHKKTIKPTYSTETSFASADYTALQPKAILFLGKDGELYSDAQCQTPYLPLAQEHQRYGAYRDLQATLMAHYYDLTHAVDTQRPIATPAQSVKELSTEPRTPLDSFESIVVPRLATQKQEQQPHPQHNDESKSVRTLRHHGVVWHIRHLPETWRPSPAALEQAARLGVTLKEGETIVREHTRGSKALGVVAGHQMITRPQASHQ